MKTLVAATNPDEPSTSPFDAIRGEDGRWSARRLQTLMGYARWQTLAPALERAMATARNEGLDVDREFMQVSELTGSRKAGTQERIDYRLTRQAAYLLAMNGDPNKPEVAAAQMYFATKTREAEIQAERPMTELELAYRYIAVLEREQALAVANAQLNEKVAELSPKAEGYDDLVAADGYISLNAAAKALAPVTGGLGATRFINLLRGMAVLMQNSTLPYQNLIDRGYFAVRIDAATGAAYTAVTLKGLRWLQAELREERPTLDHGNLRQLPTGSAEGPEAAS